MFKNYKSKRELREEIARLEGMLSIPQFDSYVSVERDVKTISCRVFLLDDNMPVDYAKEGCIKHLVNNLKSYIEWDLEDDFSGLSDRRALVGKVHIAVRRF